MHGTWNFVGHVMFHLICIIACGYLWGPLLLHGGSWAFPHESHLFCRFDKKPCAQMCVFEMAHFCGAALLRETCFWWCLMFYTNVMFFV